MSTLAIVMPVYNEEEAVGSVLDKWIGVLNTLSMDYTIQVYNDGSKDNTLKVLRTIEKKYPQVTVHDKKNSGHGPTILQGYRDNINADWIFQIDSDDEMGPDSFPALWKARGDYDFLIGRRQGRNSPISRKIISLISRMCIRFLYGQGIWDVNSPYRLLRSEKFKNLFFKIPDGTFAPNIIISGFACKQKFKIYETLVPHRERQTGEVSINKWKLARAANKSFWQTAIFSFR